MDVAKYIGLFLLKNSFVYIHGLGNLELRKKPATYNGEELLGPSYEVILTAMGSIDDNLANFIATNEQTSISKASTSLRDFSTKVRKDLEEGKDVHIPGIGKFTEERGVANFVSDPAFSHNPPSIPSARVAKKQDDIPFTTNADIPAVKPRYIDPEFEVEERSISWVKVTAWIVVLIVISALTYFGLQYIKGEDGPGEEVAAETPAMDTTTLDTTAAPLVADTAIHSNADPQGFVTFNVILNTYTTLSGAKKRLDQLTSYGNNVKLVSKHDSTAFYVVLPVDNKTPADTAHLMDSLTRVFNPRGVSILEP